MSNPVIDFSSAFLKENFNHTNTHCKNVKTCEFRCKNDFGICTLFQSQFANNARFDKLQGTKITHRDKISKIEEKVFKIKFLKPPLNL